MFGGSNKVPTVCPHCGFTQLEPRQLISTYCRGCGDHYSVAQPQPPAAKAGPKIPAKKPRRTARLIACLDCGHEQPEPPRGTLAVCESCGASLHAHDIEITGHSTQIVQTRGTVHVGKNGFLNATRITCGSALVEGRIAGRVRCAGTLKLRGNGLCRSQITTRTLLIDRGALLKIPYTITAENVVIRGSLKADIVCIGTLHIGRYGALEGDVQSRGMIVEKGGLYTGDVQVSTAIERPQPAGEGREFDLRVSPGWQPRLAFG